MHSRSKTGEMMKKVLVVAAAFACLWFVASSLPSVETGTITDSYATIAQEVGCGHRPSDEKAEDIFRQYYKDRRITVTGTIETNDNGTLGIKLLPRTLTHDVHVELAHKSDGYNLRKGDQVTVSFIMRGQGGCFLSFTGNGGKVL
jgi:hypothetical protein